MVALGMQEAMMESGSMLKSSVESVPSPGPGPPPLWKLRVDINDIGFVPSYRKTLQELF